MSSNTLPSFVKYAREDSGSSYERKRVTVVLVPGKVYPVNPEATHTRLDKDKTKVGIYIVDGGFAAELLADGVVTPCTEKGEDVPVQTPSPAPVVPAKTPKPAGGNDTSASSPAAAAETEAGK